MAFNVFLIVFYRYDVTDLRRLEIKYLVVITTVVFIPSFVFLFIRTPDKGPMYGSVIVGGLLQPELSSDPHMLTNGRWQLWCAVAPNWVIFRIILYYVPIWCVWFPLGALQPTGGGFLLTLLVG